MSQKPKETPICWVECCAQLRGKFPALSYEKGQALHDYYKDMGTTYDMDRAISLMAPDKFITDVTRLVNSPRPDGTGTMADGLFTDDGGGAARSNRTKA